MGETTVDEDNSFDHELLLLILHCKIRIQSNYNLLLFWTIINYIRSVIRKIKINILLAYNSPAEQNQSMKMNLLSK